MTTDCTRQSPREVIVQGGLFKVLTQAINQHSLQPAVDRLVLLRWAIFQVLIGNADAHCKNLSFFVHPSGVRLAPAYDITPFDWAQLGMQVSLPRVPWSGRQDQRCQGG
jgi:serine/threonine protein kinase HipA of HipAB toxin-antitoxin module